ncbi:hypothetical protein [Alteromonas oceanisediminis]|uniref:hypothetical protein n=1 Tax=Alteromonas oceanisediminis TaxID=2836180 RepID=UPI001BDB6309|nr:hypothetical protein [Alteromonas oceanisediminis]MBT0584964.1 hypothetical protein [Alteromonas oceanisediminis]
MKNDRKIFVKWLKQLTFNHRHCAFTDLVQFRGRLFCAFREASTHVSGDGIIRIFCLDLQGNLLFQQRISVASADVRDPKLMTTPDGQLLLLAYARYTNAQNQTIRTANISWQSSTGESWGSPVNLGNNFWWLWRMRWPAEMTHQGSEQAFGFAYNRRANRIDLYAGDPRRYVEKRATGVLSLAQHGLGYPNESDLHINQHREINAVVRRDADSFSAQVGPLPSLVGGQSSAKM